MNVDGMLIAAQEVRFHKNQEDRTAPLKDFLEQLGPDELIPYHPCTGTYSTRGLVPKTVYDVHPHFTPDERTALMGEKKAFIWCRMGAGSILWLPERVVFQVEARIVQWPWGQQEDE